MLPSRIARERERVSWLGGSVQVVVEGKGFDQQPPKNPNDLPEGPPHDPASEGTPRRPASHPEGEAPLS
jgi:hypothetical protein